ncbi:MAG: FecR domain-containing protein [Bacteroidota bacterium]
MKTIVRLLISSFAAGVLLQALSVAEVPPPASSIALISKVVLDVFRKETGKEWLAAKKGETLASGDKVKTGAKSIAIIKFKDNSLVRVRELTELTVTGSMDGSAFSKSVDVKSGVVGFNIKKQQTGEEFRFSSPTSVASIRGTGGSFNASSLADTLIVTDGAIQFTNNVSSTVVEVKDGFTGISKPDGTITTRPSTAEERAAAEQAARVSDQDNRLEFELRDGKGNSKRLKIDFRD